MRELLEMPLRNLSRRPKRSFITLLGIVIGVTAIVSLTAMGDGLRASVAEQFESLGTNTIHVTPGSGGLYSAGIITGAMTEDDVETIRRVRGVEEVSNYYFSTMEVCYSGDCAITWVMFVKNLEAWPVWTIETGRKTEDDEKRRITVGSLVGPDLFDRELRVGDRLEVGGEQMEIVGIAEPLGSPEDDRSIILPDGAREVYGVGDVSSSAMAMVSPSYDPAEVAERIKQRLEKNTDRTFSAETTESLLESMNSILGAVTWVFLGIAGISILVGGIGIMNTMYMSIRERTREIGVMKAIGATPQKIRDLIIVEAGLLGMAGGLVGVLIGGGIAEISTLAAQTQLGVGLFSAHVSARLVFFALTFSFCIGVASGWLPARAASQLQPVEALRYE